MATEFDEWATRFERREGVESYDYKTQRTKRVTLPPKCMYPVKEGPHKVAHLVDAKFRSLDGYPTCKKHSTNNVRPAWRGYIEGA